MGLQHLKDAIEKNERTEIQVIKVFPNFLLFLFLVIIFTLLQVGQNIVNALKHLWKKNKKVLT